VTSFVPNLGRDPQATSRIRAQVLESKAIWEPSSDPVDNFVDSRAGRGCKPCKIKRFAAMLRKSAASETYTNQQLASPAVKTDVLAAGRNTAQSTTRFLCISQGSRSLENRKPRD
jgi:hypothetical protein